MSSGIEIKYTGQAIFQKQSKIIKFKKLMNTLINYVLVDLGKK